MPQSMSVDRGHTVGDQRATSDPEGNAEGKGDGNREEFMSQDKSNKSSSSPRAAVEISRRRLLGSASLIAASAATSGALPQPSAAAEVTDASGAVLPRPRPEFHGKI